MANITEIFYTIQGRQREEVLSLEKSKTVRDLKEQIESAISIDVKGYCVLDHKGGRHPDAANLEDIALPKGEVLHLTCCTEVKVRVHYQLETIEFDVLAALRVSEVREKAIRDLNLDSTEHAKDELRLLSNLPLRDGLCLGCYVADFKGCEIELNLVPADKPQGRR